MKIQIWGCRGSIPRPNPEMARYGGNTPCIEVVASGGDDTSDDEGHRVILDLGSGAFDLGQKLLGEMFGKKKQDAEKQKQLENERAESKEGGDSEESEAPKSPPKQSKFGGSILITHTHWDHIQGLPFFVPLYLPQFEWTIFGPHGVAKSLQESLAGQMQHDYFPVRLGDMGSRTRYVGLTEDVKKGFWLGEGDKKEDAQENDAPTSIKVTTKYLNHSVLTLGYKLEEFVNIPQSNNSCMKRATRGVSMAYITDHEPFDHDLAGGGFVESSIAKDTAQPKHHLSQDESHVQFFKDVDVLLHDAQYLYKEYGPDAPTSKEYWGHSTVEYVVEVAFHANVKQLLLFHHDPQRNDEQMDDIVEYARGLAKDLEEQFADSKSGYENRVPMKVDASKEGSVYQLDPFAIVKEDDRGVNVSTTTLEDLSISSQFQLNASMNDVKQKRSVLLGLSQTNPKPICDVLQSSENTFDLKVLDNSNDVLQYAQEMQPSVIVLDEDLDDMGSGFAICEEIRGGMGEWGAQVPVMIISSKVGSSDNASQHSDTSHHESKEQQLADRLSVEDYIQGPFSPSYLLTRIQVSLLRMPLRWRRAPFSSRESQRIAALNATGLLDSQPEEKFDRITRLCSQMFNVPVSLVSLVDTDRQWFKSNTGLPGAIETPRDHAFCAHAILEDDIMVVSDALQDSRFADNPLVEGGPLIRFYAGCPIMASSNGKEDGQKFPIGTLCVIDTKPRDLGESELKALRDFGAMVEREISNSP